MQSSHPFHGLNPSNPHFAAMTQLTAGIPITVECKSRHTWEVLSRVTFANAMDLALHRSQSVAQEAPHTWSQIQGFLWQWLQARNPHPETLLADIDALLAVDTVCIIVYDEGEADFALEAAMDALTTGHPVLAVYHWRDSGAWIVANVHSSLMDFMDKEIPRLTTASPAHSEHILAIYRGWLQDGDPDPIFLLAELAGLGITDQHASLLAPVPITDVHRAAVSVYPVEQREYRVRVLALEIAGVSVMMMETTTLDPMVVLAFSETKVINKIHFQANHHFAGSLE